MPPFLFVLKTTRQAGGFGYYVAVGSIGRESFRGSLREAGKDTSQEADRFM